MKHLAILTFVVLALTGCKKDAPSTTPDDPDDSGNTGGGDDDPVTSEVDACTADEDCVAVELECCDACNGGTAVSVHQDHVDEVVAASARGRGECAATMCTMMACAEWVPSCEAGRCTNTRGSL